MKKLIREEVLDIEHSFLKCRGQFKLCIRNKLNQYLHNDIDEPLDEIVLKNKSIQIKMDSDVYGEPIVEIEISLISNKSQQVHLGYYRYIENIEGEPIDDFLVFY